MSQTSTETMDMDNLICGLKAAVTALEWLALYIFLNKQLKSV